MNSSKQKFLSEDADLSWSEPTGLIWRIVKNGAFNKLSWPEKNSLFYCGNSHSGDSIYIAKGWLHRGTDKAVIGAGMYRPKDKDDFRFPNQDRHNKTTHDIKEAMVLCTCPCDQENEYQTAWWKTTLDELDIDTLGDQNLALAVNNSKSISYLIRAYCNGDGPLHHYAPEGNLPKNHGYAIGILYCSNGKMHVKIPWGSSTKSTSHFELLMVKQVDSGEITAPSDAFRWQMANASRASYTKKDTFERQYTLANISYTRFVSSCPTLLTPNTDETLLYNFEAEGPNNFNRFTAPNVNQVNDALTYLNTLFISYWSDLHGNFTPLISVRGTNNEVPEDWLINLMINQMPHSVGKKVKGNVHEGFYHVANTLYNMMAFYPSDGKLIFTGHSQGGAIACIMAMLMKEQYPDLDITVVTFGAPKFGDSKLMTYYKKLVPKTYCYIFNNDIVPLLPLTENLKERFLEAFHITSSKSNLQKSLEDSLKDKAAKNRSIVRAILVLLIAHEGEKRVFKTQFTETQINNLTELLKSLNTAIATPIKKTTPLYQLQAALKILAPVIHNELKHMPALKELFENFNTPKNIPPSEAVIIVFSILCSSIQTMLNFMRKYRDHDSRPNYDLFFGTEQEEYEDSLIYQMQQFGLHIPDFLDASGEAIEKGYTYTEKVIYIEENNGQLNYYDHVDGVAFSKQILTKVQDEPFGDWMDALLDDHSAYWKILNPFLYIDQE